MAEPGLAEPTAIDVGTPYHAKVIALTKLRMAIVNLRRCYSGSASVLM
jgi:hypothetical protein